MATNFWYVVFQITSDSVSPPTWVRNPSRQNRMERRPPMHNTWIQSDATSPSPTHGNSADMKIDRQPMLNTWISTVQATIPGQTIEYPSIDEQINKAETTVIGRISNSSRLPILSPIVNRKYSRQSKKKKKMTTGQRKRKTPRALPFLASENGWVNETK